MAIQDDNTVLNKGDLKAYHEAIAPMLGGTFMVRTNNSDYYSTDEKVVGVWADGKPLYQKTYSLTSQVTLVQDTWTTIVTDSNLSNIDTLTKSFGSRATEKRIDVSTSVRINGSKLEGYAPVPYVQIKYFTIQYTKTTDTAGSATTTPGAYDINFPNTWLENKEIYFGNGLYGQRFTGTIATTAAVQDFTLATLPSTTTLVNVGGILKRHVMGASYYDFAIPYNYENIMGASIAIDVGVLKFIVKNSGAGNVPYDVWVTYTK